MTISVTDESPDSSRAACQRRGGGVHPAGRRAREAGPDPSAAGRGQGRRAGRSAHRPGVPDPAAQPGLRCRPRPAARLRPRGHQGEARQHDQVARAASGRARRARTRRDHLRPGRHRPPVDGVRGPALTTRRGVPAAPDEPPVRRRRRRPQDVRRHELAALRGQDDDAVQPRDRAGRRRQPGAGGRGRPPPSDRRRQLRHRPCERPDERADRPHPAGQGDQDVADQRAGRAAQWPAPAEPQRAARLPADGHAAGRPAPPVQLHPARHPAHAAGDRRSRGGTPHRRRHPVVPVRQDDAQPAPRRGARDRGRLDPVARNRADDGAERAEPEGLQGVLLLLSERLGRGHGRTSDRAGRRTRRGAGAHRRRSRDGLARSRSTRSARPTGPTRRPAAAVPSPAPRPQNGDWAAAPTGGRPRTLPGAGDDPADR